jgi:hypothetical protein
MDTSLSPIIHNEMFVRFAVRRYLRKIASGNWDGCNAQHKELALKILESPGYFDVFFKSLMNEVRSVYPGSLPENTIETSGPFMDAMMQVLNWIKDNPEFILFIIQLFGGM